tara:strand:- start:3333 stop:4574 length:1242 start_codon:yes stop_codon:yes gene_type:complete
MKILLFSQYFYPEPFIINDLVKTLEMQGHDIVVYTGKPNYPEGVIYPGFSSKGFEKTTFNGSVKLYRIPLRPRGKLGAKNLFFNYMSFVVSGIRFLNRIEEDDFDVILSFGLSPITSTIPAIFYKWKKKKSLFLWVQDLWPESLVATGYITNRIVLFFVKVLVKWIYSCCDVVLIQSHGFHKPISEYVDKKKIVFYPNSIRVEKTLPIVTIPETLNRLLDDFFCVVFAGNLGKAQSLNTILDAAEELNDLTGLKFVLIGAGSELEWLKEQKEMRHLHNVELVGRLEMDKMSFVYSKSDVLIVTLADNETINLTIPSKIQSYLSSGKPIVASLNGEGARVIKNANCGLVSEACDSHEFSENIKSVYLLTETERIEMGRNGLDYFNEHFNMDYQAENLIRIFEEFKSEEGISKLS